MCSRCVTFGKTLISKSYRWVEDIFQCDWANSGKCMLHCVWSWHVRLCGVLVMHLNGCDPIDRISVIINMAISDRSSLSESASAAALSMFPVYCFAWMVLWGWVGWKLGTWCEVWKLFLDVTVRCTYWLDGRMAASWVSAVLREKWGTERVGLLEPSAVMLLRSQASAVPCSSFLSLF